jgi:hypothetical protein
MIHKCPHCKEEYSKGFYGITPIKKFHNIKEVLACFCFVILIAEIFALGILLSVPTN